MTHITPQWMIEQGFSPTFADRFWQKVEKTESCWIWTAFRHKGYGQISRKRAIPISASQASWMLNRGPIPEGMWVLHNCPSGDNPACVNPDHLWLGNQKDNMSDCSRKGRLKIPHYFGERHPNHRFTKEQVVYIRNSWPRISQNVLAKQFGVSQTAIWNIVHFKTWPSGQIGIPEISPVTDIVSPFGRDPESMRQA